MDYKVFIPVLISFVLSVILGPLVIPVLRRLKMDQTEREDGVQSHLKKTGTPTMGGVMILLAVVITSVIYIGRYPDIFLYYQGYAQDMKDESLRVHLEHFVCLFSALI